MESLEYTLQKFDPGVVLLDANHHIVAMNQVAHRVLGNVRGDPIGRDALLSELQSEMIPYTPEELIEIAQKEMTAAMI